tara:strand:+ start:890 stop:1975 length:1086 start_codon:yes stop_codon:yes gene_type:complete
MKKVILLLLLIPLVSFGQVVESIKNIFNNEFSNLSDGPYIFINNDKLIEKTILNGEVSSKVLGINTYDTIYYPEKSTFNKIKKIAAFSDIHGQYDLAIQLLKNNKIIDNDLNWIFGKGHLVIVGDVFDRGNKVNEVLWLIYKLEIQAKSKGGRVHFLLGNHEYMIFHKDLRYINEKYNLSSRLLNLEYDELYSDKTILGRWLRSKPTIIKINENVFTHGGVSEYFIGYGGSDFEEINNIMRKSINRTKEEMKSTDFYDIYYGPKSLIWYRGYFKKYGDNLTDTDISKILKLLDSKHIVVGHCSDDKVVQLFNNKIFGVDSSIKNGKYGEVLFIENKQFFFIKNKRFFKGSLNGELVEFKSK